MTKRSEKNGPYLQGATDNMKCDRCGAQPVASTGWFPVAGRLAQHAVRESGTPTSGAESAATAGRYELAHGTGSRPFGGPPARFAGTRCYEKVKKRRPEPTEELSRRAKGATPWGVAPFFFCAVTRADPSEQE